MELQTVTRKLEKQRRNLQIMGIVYTLFYVLAFIAAIFNLWLGLALALCGVGFYQVFLRPKIKRYQRDFWENAMHFGFCAGMNDYLYSGKREVSDAALYELPLLPGDRADILCKEGFTARSKDFAVTGNEITLHYKVSRKEIDKLNYIFWSGTLLEFTWQAVAATVPFFTLLDRSLANPDVIASLKSKGVVEMELPDLALADRFILLQPESSQPVRNAVLRCVKRLARTTQNGLAICLQDQRLVVFMNGRFYTRKILVKYRVNEDVLLDPCLPGRDELLKLVRCCANAEQ